MEREKSGGEGGERESQRDERQQLTHLESLPGDGKPGNKTLGINQIEPPSGTEREGQDRQDSILIDNAGRPVNWESGTGKSRRHRSGKAARGLGWNGRGEGVVQAEKAFPRCIPARIARVLLVSGSLSVEDGRRSRVGSGC